MFFCKYNSVKIVDLTTSDDSFMEDSVNVKEISVELTQFYFYWFSQTEAKSIWGLFNSNQRMSLNMILWEDMQEWLLASRSC